MQNILRSYIVSGIALVALVFTVSAFVPAFSVGPVAFHGSVASADGDGCGGDGGGDGGDGDGDGAGADSGADSGSGSGGADGGPSDNPPPGYHYVPPTYTPPTYVAPVCSITATPHSVASGQGSILSWSTANATSASISSIGSVALGGSYGVTPTSTMTYVMTVTGPGGSSTCQTVVTVTSTPTTTAPSCTLDATISSIQQGQSTSLFWNSSNATSATLTTIGSVATTGSQSVTPQSTMTYVLTVTGTGGSATCSKTVGVTSTPYYVPPTTYDAPYCSLSANQTSVQSGGNVTLYWSSSNAYSAVIDAIGTVQTNGSYTVPNIYGTRTFVMTVQGNGGSRTCSVTVYAQAPVNYYTNYVPPAPVYIPPQPQYVPPAPVYTPPVQYSYARPASPVQYVTPTRVSLAKVPYTGAEDYMVPLFTLALALSAAYMLRGALRA